MKNLTVSLLLLLMVAPTVDARRKKDKAGKITDVVYVDGKYGFQMTIHKNGKTRINKSDNNFRFSLTQRNYTIPSKYVSAPDYTKVPRLVIFVDTTSLGAHAFVDSLVSSDYKSKQKNKVLKEFDFLAERDIIPKGRSRLDIDGESALFWKAMARYSQEVAESASAKTGKIIRSEYGGAMVSVKFGEHIVLFHMMCEWEYYTQVVEEIRQMMASLTWAEQEG